MTFLWCSLWHAHYHFSGRERKQSKLFRINQEKQDNFLWCLIPSAIPGHFTGRAARQSITNLTIQTYSSSHQVRQGTTKWVQSEQWLSYRSSHSEALTVTVLTKCMRNTTHLHFYDFLMWTQLSWKLSWLPCLHCLFFNIKVVWGQVWGQ